MVLTPLWLDSQQTFELLRFSLLGLLYCTTGYYAVAKLTKAETFRYFAMYLTNWGASLTLVTMTMLAFAPYRNA